MRLRRRRAGRTSAPENPYLGLRTQFLALGPDVVDQPLRGAAIELGFDGGSATIVCVADGTTSMYTSTGGGTIGAGAHEQVRKANAEFRAVVTAHLDLLTPTSDVPPPGPGECTIVAVTAGGVRVLRGSEASMAVEDSPAWPMFAAGQGVVTQLRLLDEQRQKAR